MKKILFLTFLLCFVEVGTVKSEEQLYLGEAIRDTYLVLAIDEDMFNFLLIKKGTLLILSDKLPHNGFFYAGELESEKYGLINSKDIKVKSSLKKSDSSPLQYEEESENYNPVVKISNNTNRTLTLTMNKNKYLFKKNESKTLYLNPGKYSYIATCPNVESKFGYEYFETYREYTWEFFIITTYK